MKLGEFRANVVVNPVGNRSKVNQSIVENCF